MKSNKIDEKNEDKNKYIKEEKNYSKKEEEMRNKKVIKLMKIMKKKIR